NMVVVISISHCKQTHAPANILVLSLAVADFVLGLFVMPFSRVRSIIFYLIFIAVDRYFVVCDPLLYTAKITMCMSLLFAAISWTVGILYICAIIYIKGNSEGLDGFGACPADCIIIFNAVWRTLDTMVTLFLPCSLILCLYTKIFAAIMIMRVAMSPACASGYLAATLTNALTWIVYFNSCMNPIIYALFYPWFKKSLELILTFKVFQPASSLINLLPGNH
ncbi:TA13C protein, partial [Polyodon spathula]|nr:TA13C protein [Polyodon spathula]